MDLSIAFRVDGSSERGMGHVMRCLALAEYLKEKENILALFIMKDLQGITKVQEFGYPVKVLAGGASLQEEVNFTTEVLKAVNIKLLVTDLLIIDEKFILELKNAGFYLISVDEIGKAKFYSDVVINGTIVEKFKQYDRVNQKTLYFLGPKYAILREDYAFAGKDPRIVQKQANNILITFGGGDLSNRTIKTIKALEGILSHRKSILLTVILGPAYEHYVGLHNLIKKSSQRSQFRIITNASGQIMVNAMSKADFAVCGGGVTLYELAMLGTPAITICEEDFENEVCRAFEQKGFCNNLGMAHEISEQDIANKVSTLIDNQDERSRMGENGKKLVDGNGLFRVSNIIMQGLLYVNR